MKYRKIRIETTLSDGSKVYFVVKGKPNMEQIRKFLNMIDLFDGDLEQYPNSINLSSVYDKVKYLIETKFKSEAFTLSDFYKAYRQHFLEDLKKSTLATYLTRLVDEGILIREGFRGRYVYRYIQPIITSKNKSCV